MQQFVGDLLLLRRQRRVERLRGRQGFVEPGGRRGEARLRTLHALDRRRRRSFPSLRHLRPAGFHLLVPGARLLAQRVGEGVPLRLLGVGDLQGGLQVSQARFHPLAGETESALLVVPLRGVPGLRSGAFRARSLRKGRRGSRGGETGGNQGAQD